MAEYELYEFEKDPLNRADVAPQHPKIVTRLARALDGWRAMAVAQRLKPDADTVKTLGADELERLRALGYVN